MEERSSRKILEAKPSLKETQNKDKVLKRKLSRRASRLELNRNNEARNEYKAIEYEQELEKNTGIPRKFVDILDLSPNAKKIYESYNRKLKTIDIFLGIICVVIIIIIYFDNDEMISSYNMFSDEYLADGTRVIYRYVNIGLNLISVLLILWRYSVLLDIHKLRLGKIADKGKNWIKIDGLYNAGLIPSLILEILVNIIFVPPVVKNPHFVLNGNFYVQYNFSEIINKHNFNYTNSSGKTWFPIKDDLTSDSYTVIKLTYTASTILSIFSLLRFYHIARIIHTYSYWTSPRAQNVCKMLNTDNNILFAIKSYLRLQPFITLLISVALIIAIFGITVKIMENYNKELLDIIVVDDYVKVMKKFENIYNSYWLIVVTMATIGYGDIYPTTYFGRVLAITACLFGTFSVSLLIVYFNNYVILEEIYNEVVDEELKEEYLKKDAIKIIWNFLKIYYLKTNYKNESHLTRLYLNLNLKYMTKKFKIQRLKCMTKELDLDEVLNNIKRDITNGLDPLKDGLEEYYFKTIKKDDYNNLKESSQLIDAFLKNSKQMWNLVRILKHDKYLEGLTSINEVYDSQVNLLEEVIHFHNMRENKLNNYKVVLSEQSSQNEEGIMKGFDFNQVFDTHNVIDKN